MTERTKGALLLEKYLNDRGINPSKAQVEIEAQFGKSKKISRVSLWQYVVGKVKPSRKHAATIQDYTGGAVTADSWDEDADDEEQAA